MLRTSTRGDYRASHDPNDSRGLDVKFNFLMGWSIKDVKGMNEAHAKLQILMVTDV
jgi:hypothetical protein